MKIQGRWHVGSFSLGLSAAALLMFSASAWAERPTDQYWLQLHAFWPSIESTARVDALATARPGTELSFENDLGMSDSETLPALLMGMRFFDNWRVDFEYYSLKRDASRLTEREIDFGDTNFELGTQLSSSFESTVYRLTVGYSFVKSQELDLGASLGLHLTDFELALAGSSSLGGAAKREARDALAPLPTIGLYGTYAISPAFGLRARADLLSFSYGDYDGSLTNVELSVDWRFSPNFSVGAGYRYVDYKLDVTSSSWKGEVNYKFDGPIVFIEAAF
jgi:opacity protein-like surface antigen